MTNKEFIEVVGESFKTYLSCMTSRSPKKLTVLHGSIARDIKSALGKGFDVNALGFGDGKEQKIEGRYYPKQVDITVTQNGVPVAGYELKFVMRNYSQNSNNYFENMLGETANVRANSIPYFQIFIVFDKLPYCKQGGEISKIEKLSTKHLGKYIKLSKDDPNVFYHTPDKTLLVVVKLKQKDCDVCFKDLAGYKEYCSSLISDIDLLTYSNNIEAVFDNGVILNNYEDFINRTYHIIMGKLKDN